jgi:hypothetical protein
MDFVYTLKAKEQTTRTIQQFAAYVQRQFQLPVKVFQTDNESSPGDGFYDWVKQLEITLVSSAIYAPQQNGSAEHSGGVPVAKARAI